MADLNSTLVQWNINHVLWGGQHGLSVRGAPAVAFSAEVSELNKC